MGIEPTQPAWEAGVLPLNYICILLKLLYTYYMQMSNCFIL